MTRLTFLALLATPATLSAQPAQDRFELGQRLRRLEVALEKTTDAKARARAAAGLEKVTSAFLTGQTAKAAEMLDLARRALASEKKPSDEARFADSLTVRPAARLLDASAKELPLTIVALYRAGKRPDKAELRVSLVPANGKAFATTTVALGELPTKTDLPLKDLAEGDYTLRCELVAAGKALTSSEQTVSVAKSLSTRLGALREGHGTLKQKEAVESGTLKRLLGLLTDLAEKKTLETNYPAVRLLREAEELLAAAKAGKPYYGRDRPGQFWLTLVTGKERDDVRVQVPDAAKKGKPLPVVVAMHGAGGSENMFFDGYGNGLVARLAAERGWIVVATRSPLALFGGGPDPARVVDALAKLYPVDKKRAFLVGHSMGAGQAVAAAGRQPDRFAAVAALGGGGRVASGDAVKKVPFFVGVGAKDFALSGARALDSALRKAGVKKVTFKKYDDVEHLLVVQLALPDVFKFFDSAAKGE